jgi:thiol-disulfide isomerase/thioredoxin
MVWTLDMTAIGQSPFSRFDGIFLAVVSLLAAVSAGCSRGDTAAVDSPAQVTAADSINRLPDTAPDRDVPAIPIESAQPWFVNEPTAPGSESPRDALPSGVAAAPPAPAVSPAPPEPQLPEDLSPSQLVDFLASADKDMELIHRRQAGIDDPTQAREMLIRIVKRKLQASRQLAGHPQANDRQRSEGNRGELQSLSHLAALSDVRAAEELERLAEARMASDDPKLVADSRLVLIGFAIESLQNGDERAVDKIVQLADQIAGNDSTADIPALIALGQAKQTLETYGQPEVASRIRDTIIEKFAASANPDVAKLAAQFAGNLVYDEVDKLREQILAGDQATGDQATDESVTIDQWTRSVETLIDAAADIQTVSYLAGAAVDFEAHGLLDFADATLRTLSSRFDQPGAATTREVQTAISATQARQQIIGSDFDPALASVSGTALQMAAYRGKIVLVPFWAAGIPLSLQPISTLQRMRDEHPRDVAIVGINLDPTDVPLEAFLRESKIDFPSFSLASDPASKIPQQFGLVSMPFVVIIDRQGKVAAIQLSGKGLQETVTQLIDNR